MSGRNPILMGEAEVIDPLLPAVRAMMEADGFYIATDEAKNPNAQVPLVVQDGKVFCMVVDKELDPAAFFETVRIAGPFWGPVPESSSAPAEEDADEPGETWWHGVSVKCKCGERYVLMPEDAGKPLFKLRANARWVRFSCPSCGAEVRELRGMRQ